MTTQQLESAPRFSKFQNLKGDRIAFNLNLIFLHPYDKDDDFLLVRSSLGGVTLLTKPTEAQLI